MCFGFDEPDLVCTRTLCVHISTHDFNGAVKRTATKKDGYGEQEEAHLQFETV